MTPGAAGQSDRACRLLPGLDETRLSGHGVSLIPLAEEHADELLRAASQPETFLYFSACPTPWNTDGMRGYVRRLLAEPMVMPYAIREDSTRSLVGSTSFCDIRPANRGLEIGWTWYAPAGRGTRINPACKLLLLRSAFEIPLFPTGPALRVQLKTDARNTRSRAALLKLGATFEGMLRQHVVMPDGFVRSSALYSITAEEWPGVRAKLNERLGSG